MPFRDGILLDSNRRVDCIHLSEYFSLLRSSKRNSLIVFFRSHKILWVTSLKAEFARAGSTHNEIIPCFDYFTGIALEPTPIADYKPFSHPIWHTHRPLLIFLRICKPAAALWFLRISSSPPPPINVTSVPVIRTTPLATLNT